MTSYVSARNVLVVLHDGPWFITSLVVQWMLDSSQSKHSAKWYSRSLCIICLCVQVPIKDLCLVTVSLATPTMPSWLFISYVSVILMSFLFRTSQHKIIEVKFYPKGNIHTLLLLAAYYVANISREKNSYTRNCNRN